MVTAFIVIVVLLIMGCCIAYLGDTWGYKLGKKRLTLFGLRPRVTANLLTVIAGGVIALLTLSVLLALSADFRTALTQGAQLRQQNRMLESRNHTLLSGNHDLEDQNKTLRQQEQGEAVQEQQTHKSLLQAEKRLAALQPQLQAADQKLQKVNNQLQVAQNQVAAAQTRVAALQTQKQQLIQETKDLGEKAKFGITHHMIYANNAEVGRT